MKNRISIGLIVMLLILTATSCSPKSNSNTSINESSSQSSQQEINSPELITTEDYLRTLSNEEKCWMNITSEQYLDDYDMLYQQLTENYPYFGVAQRKYSVDIRQQYEQYRERVSVCKNDDEFWQLIRGFINEMQYTGHIAAWGYRYMSQVEGMRNFVLEYPEYAAMFSKQSGFATLVGTQTGGDGIGVDPTYIILPNSGLVIQYSPVYGVTSDGKNSEEYGTTPDITIEEGKTALETCLNVIDTMK